jgi:hypothetical protein
VERGAWMEGHLHSRRTDFAQCLDEAVHQRSLRLRRCMKGFALTSAPFWEPWSEPHLAPTVRTTPGAGLEPAPSGAARLDRTLAEPPRRHDAALAPELMLAPQAGARSNSELWNPKPP